MTWGRERDWAWLGSQGSGGKSRRYDAEIGSLGSLQTRPHFYASTGLLEFRPPPPGSPPTDPLVPPLHIPALGECERVSGLCREKGQLHTCLLSPATTTSGLFSSSPGPVPHPLLPCAPQTPSHRGRGGGPCRRGDCRGPAHGSSHEPETYRDGEQAWDGVGSGYRAMPDRWAGEVEQIANRPRRMGGQRQERGGGSSRGFSTRCLPHTGAACFLQYLGLLSLSELSENKAHLSTEN